MNWVIYCFCHALYCAVLYYTALCCTVCCTVLLYYTALCVVLCCTILHCVLCCAILHYIVLCAVLSCVMYYTIPHFAVLHYVLHCVSSVTYRVWGRPEPGAIQCAWDSSTSHRGPVPSSVFEKAPQLTRVRYQCVWSWHLVCLVVPQFPRCQMQCVWAPQHWCQVPSK